MGFDFGSLVETEEERKKKEEEEKRKRESVLNKPVGMPVVETPRMTSVKVDLGSFVDDKDRRSPDWKRQAGVGNMPTKREFYNVPDWVKNKDIPEIGEKKAGLFDILGGVAKETGKELILDLPKKLVSGAVSTTAEFLETGERFAEKGEWYKMNQKFLKGETSLGKDISEKLRKFEKKIDEDESMTMYPFAQKFAKTIGSTAVDLLVMKQYIKGAGGVIAKVMKGKDPKVVVEAINKWGPGIGMAFYGALDGASRDDVKQAITGAGGGFAMGKLHGIMRIIKPKLANIGANVWGFSSIATMQHLIDTGEMPDFLGEDMLQTYMLGYAFELVGGKRKISKKEVLKVGETPPPIKDITKPKIPETLPEMGEFAKEVRTTSELEPVRFGKKKEGMLIEEPIKEIAVKGEKGFSELIVKIKDSLKTNPDTEMSDYMTKELSKLEGKNIKDITPDELATVRGSIDNYNHRNKLEGVIKVGEEIKPMEQVLKDSIAEMKPKKEIKVDLLSKPQGKFNRLKETGTLIKDTFGIRQESYNLIVESIAGKNSTTDKVLFKALDKGTDIELKYSQNISENFQKDIKGIDIKGGGKWLKETVTTGNLKLTHNERMALYRHSINTKNRASLLEGGFYRTFSDTPNRLHKITEPQLNKIIDSLTKQELAYANEPVTNFYENEYNRENPIFMERHGVPIPKEHNYYPAEKRVGTKEVIGSSEYLCVGLPQGRFKAKVDTQLPINLNPLTYDLNKSMKRAGAYIGYEIPLSNASKLLRGIKPEIESRYGKQMYIELEKGLRDIVGEYKTHTTVEKLLMRGKNKLATVFLGLNPFVIAKQPLSLFLYSHYVKPQFLMMGIIDSIWHPRKTIKEIKLNSPKATARFGTGYSRDVSDVFKSGSERRFYGGGKSFAEKVMGGIKWGDRRAVVPGMRGAVRQVLHEFKKGKLSREVKRGLDMQDSDIANLTPGQQIRLAYEYADYATGRGQPMFLPAYMSSLARGTPVEKLGTMFGSFTNQALNETKRNFRDAVKSRDPQAYAKLAKTVVSIYVLNTLAVIGIDEFRNKLYKRKGDEGVVGKVVSTWAGYMFFVRDLVRSAVSKIERGTYQGYDPELPISRIPNLITDFVAHGAKIFAKEKIGENKKKSTERKKKDIINFVDDSAELLLMRFGIPYQTPKKIIKAVIEPNADKIKRLEKEKRRLKRAETKLRNAGKLTLDLMNKYKERYNKIQQQIRKYGSGAS